MNVLYLANPHDNHDVKWITFFVEKNVKGFLMPRIKDTTKWHNTKDLGKTVLLSGINDFSIFQFHKTLRTAYFIRKFIKSNNINVVHVMFAEPNALWCLFRWYFSVPIIITCRGTDVLKTIPRVFKEKSFINFFVAIAYRWAFRAADFVTGTSHQQLESITAFSGRTKNMRVVRTGVNLQYLHSDTSPHFPLEDNQPYILFPRYIRPLYNHLFCLKAIEEFPAEVKNKYKMVFVGKDSKHCDSEYQEQMIQRMKSMQGVVFDFLKELDQEQLFELYKRSSLVVMTPLSDGSPVTAMEAIASGCKVILGPLNYDSEIFGEWAYQLKNWDATELTNLMVHCLHTSSPANLRNYFSLVDQKIEMGKIADLYNTLVYVDCERI